jgi:hypothetical protein
MKGLRKLGSGLGSMVDGAVLTALRYTFTKPSRGSGLERRAPLGAGGAEVDRRAALQTAIDYYERADVRASFFPVPPPVVPSITARGRLDDDGDVLDLAWPSAYLPHWDATQKEYLAHEENRASKVRLLLHPRPARTAIICLHGYRGGGSWFFEERAFQTRWLYSLGADVALFTLPFHGPRAGRRAPSWPSPNPVRTNEGFAHAIFDLRALVAWLRARPGAEQQKIAVIGMSLGGYTTSLFGTTDALDFIAPMIPVADWPELLWSHGEGQAEQQRAEREGITLEVYRRAMSIVAPLERAPLVDPERVLVLSAYGDRIAPPDHAERIARHFGGVHLKFAGGHVLQLGRRDAFSAIAQRLALVGLIAKRA